MKIFNIVDFLVYVEKNDGLYFNESYGEIKKIVNENGNGVYSLMYGSRGEVEFRKVNLVDELLEWNSVSNEENEFRSMEGGFDEKLDNRDNDYLDLVFDEEDFRCYFFIMDDYSFDGVK